MVFIHHLSLFTLEAFSFQYFGVVVFKTLVSLVITILLIFTLEKVRK
jgi:hypothetical protein